MTIHRIGRRLECGEKKTSLNYDFIMDSWRVTLVPTGYGIFSGVVLALPFPYNYLTVINSFMVGVIEIHVGALIGMHS